MQLSLIFVESIVIHVWEPKPQIPKCESTVLDTVQKLLQLGLKRLLSAIALRKSLVELHAGINNLQLSSPTWYFSVVSSWTCDTKEEMGFVGFSKETLCWHSDESMQG